MPSLRKREHKSLPWPFSHRIKRDDHAVADEYGVYNLFSDSEAAASVFIISQDGRIVWDHIASTQTERVQSETILENLPE
jgi:alkyl hydroperoxide reductase subunit AhpC